MCTNINFLCLPVWRYHSTRSRIGAFNTKIKLSIVKADNPILITQKQQQKRDVMVYVLQLPDKYCIDLYAARIRL